MINKKNGFTLVEVIATIAIIGLIAGISFPAVSNMLSNKEEEIESDDGKIIEQLKDATEIYVQMNPEIMYDDDGNDQNSKDICISALIGEGVISTKKSNKEDLYTTNACIEVTNRNNDSYKYEYKKNCSCN